MLLAKRAVPGEKMEREEEIEGTDLVVRFFHFHLCGALGDPEELCKRRD
jgi:hypothetical protein